VGYAVAVLGIGLLPALLADPAGAGCQACPRDLLAVASEPDAALRVTRLALAAGALWSLAAAAVLVRRVAVAAPALRRARAGVGAAAAAFLVLTASAQLWQLATESLGVDATLRRLHVGQALALVALAAAVAWGWTRRGRTRARVARLVLDLAATPPPGGLRDSLARALGDETLRLGYWLADGRLVDVAGQPLEVSDGSATPLVEGGRPVALLVHRPGLLDDLRVADEVAAAARLALENERLQAELAAQLAHLRASRQRIVATADAARRRLERDLHDGAQQQLVGLLLRLRLDRARWPADVGPGTVALAARAERALQAAVDELRDLARGIFPSALVEEGLAPAVEDFAETAAVPVAVRRLPDQRLPQPVESAGYFLLAEAVRRSGAPGAAVEADVDGDRLRLAVDLSDVGSPDGWLTSLEDRVGASDGTLSVVPTSSGLRIEAVIPCAS
jgi:signal transduction histidine kinase